jgi:hypothetical protein
LYELSEFWLAFRLSLFSRLRFHSVGCGKFALPMRFGPQSTRMQFTGLVDGCGARRTRHAVNLFPGKIFGFHCPIMERFITGVLLNIAHRKSQRRKELLRRGMGQF